MRRRYPIVGAGVLAAVCLATRLAGQLKVVNVGGAGGAIEVLVFGVVFLLSYAMGTDPDLRRGLVGVALLVFAVNVINDAGFNPFIEVLAVGPWSAGRVVASRRRMTEQLQARAQQLEAERELFARESVRFERTRIARELHDIVGHCMSVMVVQASAGQRLIAADPAQAAEALGSIAEAAKQAEEEVGRLVELLGDNLTANQPPGLHLVERLVQHANATGIGISCRFEGNCDRLGPPASDAAFRVIQEGITNAFKHAPGAPVDIVGRETMEGIEIEVINAPARAESLGLEETGGGHGLNGMRARVSACGGQLTAGPTAGGGWRVAVLFQPAKPEGEGPE
jgi:signal transduction histidine kinase